MIQLNRNAFTIAPKHGNFKPPSDTSRLMLPFFPQKHEKCILDLLNE